MGWLLIKPTMKKFIFIFFTLLLLAPQALAGECEVITDVEDYWMRVTSGVNIRDQVCDGNVIGTLSTGTVVKVVGEIEGWRYIVTPEGGNGFVWSDFMELSSAPENQEQEETPEPEVVPEEEEEAEALSDVAGTAYETAIRYLAEHGIVQGYPDGTYQPAKTVNRAEFTKIIVGAKLGSEPTSSVASCFPDVKESDWFSSYVCYAKDNGIIAGYDDGSFKPGSTINLAEAAKIMVNSLGVQLNEDESGFWYSVFLRSLQDSAYIPDSFKAAADMVSRGQMAELIHRIMEDIQNKPAKSFSVQELSNSSGKVLTCADTNVPEGIDIDQARAAWFAWVNGARNEAGKASYSASPILDATAQAWSDYSANLGVMNHNRPGQTQYYDYALITKWFEDLGVTFKNVGGWTYSENIGRTWYNCDKSDCTQELIDGTKLIFDAYMAEKGTSYTAHYDSVMGKFNAMGVAWTFKGKDVYVTIHYAVEIDKEPSLTCN